MIDPDDLTPVFAAHRRFNPLRHEWVIVSPRRNERPRHGHVDAAAVDVQPPHDPACHLCAGNERARSIRNAPGVAG